VYFSSAVGQTPRMKHLTPTPLLISLLAIRVLTALTVEGLLNLNEGVW